MSQKNSGGSCLGTGCLIVVIIGLFYLASLFVMIFAMPEGVKRANPTTWWIGPIVGIAISLLVFWGVFKLLLLLRTPKCPHCGASTNNNYRICKNCGRVK